VECFLNPNYRSIIKSDEIKSDDEAVERWVETAEQCVERKEKYFRLVFLNETNMFEPRKEARKLIRILREIRKKVGADMELMVDLHARLDPSTGLMFCKEVEELNLFVVEDPIRSENMQGYRNIRKHTYVPLAAGEQWANKWEFRQCIEEELIDYVRVDVAIAGGISETKKIAGMAETHNIKLLLHNPLGPINTAAALHLDLACDNAGPQEIVFPPAGMLPSVFECFFNLNGIILTIPRSSGIGVTFDKDKALQYPADFTEPPHFRQSDGAFTNY
jgi:galactonate dehydratase